MIQHKSYSLAAVTAAVAALFSVGAAEASDAKCTPAPQAQWRTIDDAKAALVAQGFDVVSVKIENSCYEAYARKDGRKVEVYVDPMSLAVVTTKDKS